MQVLHEKHKNTATWEKLSFLSDSGPIIVYTCQSLTNYLTGFIAIPMIGNYLDTN